MFIATVCPFCPLFNLQKIQSDGFPRRFLSLRRLRVIIAYTARAAARTEQAVLPSVVQISRRIRGCRRPRRVPVSAERQAGKAAVPIRIGSIGVATATAVIATASVAGITTIARALSNVNIPTAIATNALVITPPTVAVRGAAARTVAYRISTTATAIAGRNARSRITEIAHNRISSFLCI